MAHNQAMFFHPDILASVAKQQYSEYWQFQVADKDKSIVLVLSEDELSSLHSLLTGAIESLRESERLECTRLDVIDEPTSVIQQVRVHTPARAVKPTDEKMKGLIYWLLETYSCNKQISYETIAQKLCLSLDDTRAFFGNIQPWRDRLINKLQPLIKKEDIL